MFSQLAVILFHRTTQLVKSVKKCRKVDVANDVSACVYVRHCNDDLIIAMR